MRSPGFSSSWSSSVFLIFAIQGLVTKLFVENDVLVILVTHPHSPEP